MGLDYLYYKLYQAALKSSVKDIANFAASAWLSGLIGVNIFVIYLFFVKMDLLPYVFTSARQGGLVILLILIIALLYFNKPKIKSILEKYSVEDNRQRIKGNIWISLYVAISFLLIFAVAFFKPVGALKGLK